MDAKNLRKRKASEPRDKMAPKTLRGPFQGLITTATMSLFRCLGSDGPPEMKKPIVLAIDPDPPFKLDEPVNLFDKAALDARITQLERKENRLSQRQDKY
ncbi:hypothetical protein AC579_4279 [Pseudocercospora musae]|uniref:Uncharacterized protein n=1 Tax=Pseudocercospora musae TaxID=113226 RepID=A0A139IAU1_9PEZI|nr:hypothetical protein AC579_4279 [Pseudocercospora musae]